MLIFVSNTLKKLNLIPPS